MSRPCALITLGKIGALLGDIIIEGSLNAVGTVNLNGDFVFAGGSTTFTDATFLGTTTIAGVALNVTVPSTFTAPATFNSVAFAPTLVAPANPLSLWLNGNTVPPTLQFGANPVPTTESATATWDVASYNQVLLGGGPDPLLPPSVGTNQLVADRLVYFYKVGRLVTMQFIETISFYGNNTVALIGSYHRVLLSLTFPAGFAPPDDVVKVVSFTQVGAAFPAFQPATMRVFDGGGIEFAADVDTANPGFEVAAVATPPTEYTLGVDSIISISYLVDP